MIVFALALIAPKLMAQKLLLYGNDEAKTFLGCLSCGQLDHDSVLNELGPYGSKLSSTSIWNSLGAFGSKLSPAGVCNVLSTNGPSVVDSDGKYYGHLTANRLDPARVTSPPFEALVRAICAG